MDSKNTNIAIAGLVVVLVIGTAIYLSAKSQGKIGNNVKGVNATPTPSATVSPIPTISPVVTETAADKLGPNEVKITDANFDKEVLQADKPVLVDFYLSGCSHCQKVAPTVTDFANRFVGQVKVGKLECSQNPTKADVYKIQSVPKFILFKDGKEVGSLEGSAVTVDQFKQLLDQFTK